MPETKPEVSSGARETALFNLVRQAIRAELREISRLERNEERLLTVEQVAQILSVSKDWIYRNATKFAFTRKLGPKIVRFSETGLQSAAHSVLHAHWGFFEDHVGVRLRHEIGVDRIMWSTDFPHVVSRWRKSLQKLEQQMAGVPEAEERRQMVAGNAIRFFALNHKSATATQPGSDS